MLIGEKKAEEDFSFADTMFYFWQRRFCKFSASKGREAYHKENALGFTPTVPVRPCPAG